MEPARIPPASSLPVSGLASARQVDPQHPVKQVQQEDQIQFSTKSGQVAGLKSEMDATIDRQNRPTAGRQKQAGKKKPAGSESATGKDSLGETGNRLDVEG